MKTIANLQINDKNVTIRRKRRLATESKNTPDNSNQAETREKDKGKMESWLLIQIF